LKYEDVKEYIESFNYKLLSKEYKNCETKLSMQCDKGHEYQAVFSAFKHQKQRCPICNNESTSSKAEIEIQKDISSYTENVICNDRKTILNPLTNHYLELDIYLPYLNKAIEYNGTY